MSKKSGGKMQLLDQKAHHSSTGVDMRSAVPQFSQRRNDGHIHPGRHGATSVPTFEMGVLQVGKTNNYDHGISIALDYKTHYDMGDVLYGPRFPHPTEISPKLDDILEEDTSTPQSSATRSLDKDAQLLGPSPCEEEESVANFTSESLTDPDVNPRLSLEGSKPLPYTQSPCPYYPNEETLMLEYIYLVVPRHPCFSSGYRSIWESLMQFAQYEETQMARNAFLCMAATRMGRWVGSPELYEWGRKIYAATLSQLLQALKDGTVPHVTTFVTAYLLSQYGCIEVEAHLVSGSMWQAHFRGSCAIMQDAGSEALLPRDSEPVLPSGPFLLWRVRWTALAIAMGLRESMPIIENGWESQRWQIITTHLVPFLPHGIASIPSILQRADQLDADFRHGSCTCTRFYELIAECSNLGESLERWYEEIEHAAGDKALYELQPSQIDRENARRSNTPFPQQYRFQNPAVSVHLVLYWSAQLLLRATIDGLEKNLEQCALRFHFNSPSSASVSKTQHPTSSSQGSSSPFLVQHTPHLHSLATHIALSTEYMTHDDIRFIGPYLLIHPLHLAAQVYDAVPGQRGQRDWCHSMIACINLGGHPFETPYEKEGVRWCPEAPRRLPIRFQTSFPPLKGFGRLRVGGP